MQVHRTLYNLPWSPRQCGSRVGSKHIYDHCSLVMSRKSLIHNSVKNRTQRKAIASTEHSGETGGRHTMLGSDRRIQNLIFRASGSMRILDIRVEAREDMAIRGCSGTVCLIYDDNLHCPVRSIAVLESHYIRTNTTHMLASPAAAQHASCSIPVVQRRKTFRA